MATSCRQAPRTLKEAKEFLAYLGSVEAQQSMAEDLGRIVAQRMWTQRPHPPMTQKGIELIQGADLWPSSTTATPRRKWPTRA